MTPATAADRVPEPTGKHAVGRLSYDWVDSTRTEIYGANGGDPRELVVFVWYPAKERAAELAPYLPQAWAPVADFLGINVAGLRSHAVPDATVAADDSAYPVLLLSPSGFPPLLLTAIAEELASHGFIVVGVNHTYETAVTAFGDGRVVPINPAAIGGALGPQTGSHDDVFRQRASICEYKAADLASVAFLPVTDASIVKPALEATEIQPQRMWRITCDLMLAFFDKYLNGATATVLDGPADEYPEVTIGPP